MLKLNIQLCFSGTRHQTLKQIFFTPTPGSPICNFLFHIAIFLVFLRSKTYKVMVVSHDRIAPELCGLFFEQRSIIVFGNFVFSSSILYLHVIFRKNNGNRGK